MCRGPLRACGLAFLGLLLAGCLPLDGRSDDGFEAAAGRSDLAVLRPERRSRRATWIIVRTWRQTERPQHQKDADPGAPGDRVAVRSLHQDVVAAGLRLSVDRPPDGPHETMLLKKEQSGFAAIARSERVRQFEVAGRPLGGGQDDVDAGFEVVAELTRAGALTLRMAPLFRNLAATSGEEVRVGALSFEAEVASGQTIRLGAVPGPLDRVLTALFIDPAGDRRTLWIQPEVFR